MSICAEALSCLRSDDVVDRQPMDAPERCLSDCGKSTWALEI